MRDPPFVLTKAGPEKGIVHQNLLRLKHSFSDKVVLLRSFPVKSDLKFCDSKQLLS